MQYININGKITAAANATIPVDNGAFRYGYGLFETMLVQQGSIALLPYHMERLFAGMQQLYFEIPSLLNPGKLEEHILDTVRKNGLENLCRVRLQVYAGGGGLFGQDAAKPGFVIECFSLNEEAIQYNENGLVLGIVEGLSKNPDSLSNLKSCNALVYAMAARQAKAQKRNDALIRNTSGNVIESTIANIFWVKDNTIHTPPLTEGCIAGVMRRNIIDKIPGIIQEPLTIDALMNADEVFLTNAIRKIKWVREIGNSIYNNKISLSLLS